jgi:hypothetical protein
VRLELPEVMGMPHEEDPWQDLSSVRTGFSPARRPGCYQLLDAEFVFLSVEEGTPEEEADLDVRVQEGEGTIKSDLKVGVWLKVGSGVLALGDVHLRSLLT